jgi:Flp pilus assembly protein TadG
MRLPHSVARSGAAAVETAFVLPVIFLFLGGIVVGAYAVFSYHEVAALAREGARYASVHGTRYQAATSQTAATADDVYNNAIRPRMITLNPARVRYAVSWDATNAPGNLVTVHLEYDWLPPGFFSGQTMSSTVTQQMTW